MMKVIVDSLGGDLSPKEVLLGCADALKENKELELVVVGEKETILKGIGDEGGDISRVEVIEATEAVLNTDHPANFLREKPNSSLAVLFETAKQREDIQACVSAGPTGAVLTGAIFKLGRLKGVKRPALIACMPAATIGGVSLVLYGMISAVGVRNIVENQVDFTASRNVIIAALILVLAIGIKYGAGDSISLGFTSLSGLAVAALTGIILNAVLPGKDYEFGSNSKGDKSVDFEINRVE